MKAIKLAAPVLACALMAVVPGVVYAGGGGGGGPCAGFASGSTLTMRDSCFDGVAHFAQAGATLLVRNEGVIPHSFRAVDGSFDTGTLNPGQSAEIPLGKAGIIGVYCHLHGTAEGHGMAGVLIVGEPEQISVGSGGRVDAIQAALREQEQSILKELNVQSELLSTLEGEISDLRETAGSPWRGLGTTLGALGILLGGVALLVASER